jgi:hypothetical protein
MNPLEQWQPKDGIIVKSCLNKLGLLGPRNNKGFERHLMTNNREFDRQVSYRIILNGVLDPSWSDWFDGFSISSQADSTILSGIVPDQSALHGILAKINDLSLTIVSVEKISQD